MKYEVTLPQLTETMEEAVVTNWFKQVGDYVEKNEKLYEVETDKATQEVESLDAGYLCSIHVQAGNEVSVGDVLAVLADSSDEC